MDAEGLVLGSNGTLWVSDEYGPYIYQFSSMGQMLQAIRPPAAYIPLRNGSISFSLASPPVYNQDVVIEPEDPHCGRANNRGFEGLTISSNGKRLYTLLQSALTQEGGGDSSTRRQARLVVYDISRPGNAEHVHEYVVTLPTYDTGTRVAGQSSLHYVTDKQYTSARLGCWSRC